MKTLLIATCACLFFAACARSVSGKGTDELLVRVQLTTGERSKDSNSQTTTITVERDAVTLEQTFGGSNSRRPTPARKVYKLSHAGKRNLLKLIESNNLLVTDSIELPRKDSNFRYFEILVDVTVNEKKGAIKISGMRTALPVKEEKLYQNSIILIKELYRIMHSQDQNVLFEELILEPVKR